MENNLIPFRNEQFGTVRTLIRDGEPWFVAADACRALDISNVSQALSRLDDDEKMTIALTEGHSGKRGGAQFLTIVNEAGLYVLILSSRKKEAKAFKRWIVHEVLPDIRRNGVYMTKEAAFQFFNAPDFFYALATQYYETTKKNAALKEANAALTRNIELLSPKADYYDKVLASDSLVKVKTIAQDYGMTAQQFNKLLEKMGVQYKVGGQWILTQTYLKLGWVQSKTHTGKGKNGESYTFEHTYWTQKGRLGIRELLKDKMNLRPMCER